MRVWEELRSRGRQLLANAEDERHRRIKREQAAAAQRQEGVARKATQAVQRMLGQDIASALGPWRGTDPAFAAIGEPDPGRTTNFLPGDALGQHGELKFYSRADRQDELWYRPPMTDASARIRDRDHFAQMLAQHSIYAGTP